MKKPSYHEIVTTFNVRGQTVGDRFWENTKILKDGSRACVICRLADQAKRNANRRIAAAIRARSAPSSSSLPEPNLR